MLIYLEVSLRQSVIFQKTVDMNKCLFIFKNPNIFKKNKTGYNAILKAYWKVKKIAFLRENCKYTYIHIDTTSYFIAYLIRSEIHSPSSPNALRTGMAIIWCPALGIIQSQHKTSLSINLWLKDM